jgi:hypothetical protein
MVVLYHRPNKNHMYPIADILRMHTIFFSDMTTFLHTIFFKKRKIETFPHKTQSNHAYRFFLFFFCGTK